MYHNVPLLQKIFTRHRLKNIREKALICKALYFCTVIFSYVFKEEADDGFLKQPKMKHILD
jgi:hypothetical protein